MADSYNTGKTTGLDSNAIYYEVSPTIICFMRLYNVLAGLMVVIAFVITLIKAQDHDSNYLLACNILLSSLVAIVINWWYKRSELPADKYWYIFLVASVIILQTIVTDIYAFRKPEAPPPGTPRPHPTFSTHPYTGSTIPWVTINASTLTPPTSRFLFSLLPQGH